MFFSNFSHEKSIKQQKIKEKGKRDKKLFLGLHTNPVRGVHSWKKTFPITKTHKNTLYLLFLPEEKKRDVKRRENV